MNSFTACCAVFLAAFVLVSSDTASDVAALTQKIVAEYMKLNVNETKERISDNMKRMVVFWNMAIEEYEKEDLVVAAQFYKAVKEWSIEGLKKSAEIMDKQEEKEKKQNWMEMGIAIQLNRDLTDAGMKNSSHPNVTQTEEEAKKMFVQESTKVLHIVKGVTEMLKKKGKIFWSDVHKDIHQFLEKEFKTIETEIKTVKTNALKAKNYQAINMYLKGLLDATEGRAQPQTFFAKVGQKFKDLYNKIKSIF